MFFLSLLRGKSSNTTCAEGLIFRLLHQNIDSLINQFRAFYRLSKFRMNVHVCAPQPETHQHGSIAPAVQPGEPGTGLWGCRERPGSDPTAGPGGYDQSVHVHSKNFHCLHVLITYFLKLDVDVPHPDEKSIITYVSSLYDAMPRSDVHDGARVSVSTLPHPFLV